jgi:hypothetical protein
MDEDNSHLKLLPIYILKINKVFEVAFSLIHDGMT